MATSEYTQVTKANDYHVINIHNNKLDSDGKPVAPSSSDLFEGEIAVNTYADDSKLNRIYIKTGKNESGNASIVDFPTTAYVDDELSKKASSGDLESKQDKLTSDNAGTNVTISTDESGKVTISAIGGGSSVDVVQTTGTSTTSVMSQKAVTDELGNKQDKLSDAQMANVNADLSGTYAKIGDAYTKAESDAKYLTEHQSLADYAKSADVDKKQDKLSDAQLANLNEDHSKYITDISGKQDVLTAGDGIDITNDVISCTLDKEIAIIVDSLPTAPATGNENKIHMVKNTDTSAASDNTYIEYLYKNSKWEKIGEWKAEIDTDSIPYIQTISLVGAAQTSVKATAYNHDVTIGITGNTVKLSNVTPYDSKNTVLKSDNTVTNTFVELEKVILDNEESAAEALNDLDSRVIKINNRLSNSYLTKEDASSTYQPIGNYLTEEDTIQIVKHVCWSTSDFNSYDCNSKFYYIDGVNRKLYQGTQDVTTSEGKTLIGDLDINTIYYVVDIDMFYRATSASLVPIRTPRFMVIGEIIDDNEKFVTSEKELVAVTGEKNVYMYNYRLDDEGEIYATNDSMVLCPLSEQTLYYCKKDSKFYLWDGTAMTCIMDGSVTAITNDEIDEMLNN